MMLCMVDAGVSVNAWLALLLRTRRNGSTAAGAVLQFAVAPVQLRDNVAGGGPLVSAATDAGHDEAAEAWQACGRNRWHKS